MKRISNPGVAGKIVYRGPGVSATFDAEGIAVCEDAVAESFRGIPGYTIEGAAGPPKRAIKPKAPAKVPQDDAIGPPEPAEAPQGGPPDVATMKYHDLLAHAKALGYQGAHGRKQPPKADLLDWLENREA